MKHPLLGLFFCTISSFASQSMAAIELDHIFESRRALVQDESKYDATLTRIQKNDLRIRQYKSNMSQANKSIIEVDDDIHTNEQGISLFPELTDLYKPKIQALLTAKSKLITQKDQYQTLIEELVTQNSELASMSKEIQLDILKSKQNLSELQQAYLNKQVNDAIGKAGVSQKIIETHQVTCSFSDIYGKQQGNKQACLTKAIEQAKRSAADKYSPTIISSEIKSENFQITSETSSQYYSVNVVIQKEFSDETWVKMEHESERFRAQFKAQIQVEPVFTLKTRQKLMEGYAVKLSTDVSQVAAAEKRSTINDIRKQVQIEEEAKTLEQRAAAEFEALRLEIEQLKKANSSRQIQEQQQASAEAERLRASKQAQANANIQAKVDQRLALEKQTIEKQAKAIEKEATENVFIPPVL